MSEVLIFDTSDGDIVFHLKGVDPEIKKRLREGPHTFAVVFETKNDGEAIVHHIGLYRSGPGPFIPVLSRETPRRQIGQ